MKKGKKKKKTPKSLTQFNLKYIDDAKNCQLVNFPNPQSFAKRWRVVNLQKKKPLKSTGVVLA